MGLIFRLLSSPRISYLSVACGSLVLYKALCSRCKRKKYETTLSAASYAGSAAAVALPTRSVKDGLTNPFASLAAAAAVDVAPSGAEQGAGASAACVVPDLRSKRLQRVSRDAWREALGSAKAAANAAGLSERELDSKQLAAAMAAAHVLSTMQHSSSISSTADFSCRSGHWFPCPISTFRCLQHFVTRTATISGAGVGKNSPFAAASSNESRTIDTPNSLSAHAIQRATGATPAQSTDAVAADALSQNKNVSSHYEAPASLRSRAASEISSNFLDHSNIIGDRRLCVGRIAAVQVVKRPLRVVWPRTPTSETAGERAVSERCSTRPYVQWPGKFLRVTYQYFVESPNKTIPDLTVRTEEGREWRGGHDCRAPYTERKGKDDTGESGDSRLSPLPASEQRIPECQKNSSITLHTTEKHDEEGSPGTSRWWEYLGPYRFRSTFGVLKQKLSLSRSGNACTAHQAESSPCEWMPPLSICEATVELRLPPKGYMQTRSRRATEETPPPVGKYSSSRDSENPYVVGASAQAAAAEAPADAAAVPPAKSDTEKTASGGRAEKPATAAAVPTGSAAAAGGNVVSDGSTDVVFTDGGKHRSVYPTGSQLGQCGHDGDGRCVDLTAVKALKPVTQAWQDIKPQQLVVVSYEAGKPLQSMPLLVLAQPDKRSFYGVPVTGESNAVVGSSKCKDGVSLLARTSTVVRSEKKGSAAVTNSGGVHRASITAARDEKGNESDEKQLQLPYSGELIELLGNTNQSGEKVMLSGGGFLVGLGLVKLCLQKLLMRRFLK